MGLVSSILADSFPPAPHFVEKDVPDLTGKVIIVTGANSGIGKETARVLLTKNAKVYLAGRNARRLEDAIADLKELTGKEGIPLILDLADLNSVKAAADEFMSQEKRLNVLINNAGILQSPVELTPQGHEMQFGVNVLGHFYFTKLLLPLLTETAERTGEPGRIMHFSSITARVGLWGLEDFDTLKAGPALNAMGGVGRYAQSKFGNAVMSRQFAKRFGGENGHIISTSINPGNISTGILNKNSWMVRPFALLWCFHPVEMGALTQLWAATSPEGLALNGKSLGPWCRERPEIRRAEDEALGDKLWEWLEEQVKNFELGTN